MSHLAPLVTMLNDSLVAPQVEAEDVTQLEPKKQLKVEPDMKLLTVQTISSQMSPDYDSSIIFSLRSKSLSKRQL